MAQTEQLLLKLSKDVLTGLVLDYQGKFDLVLKTVKDDICEMKTKFAALESELHVSKTVTDNLTKYIKTLETKCYENEQYSRRECLEIPGIPGSIVKKNVMLLLILHMLKIAIIFDRLIIPIRKLL